MTKMSWMRWESALVLVLVLELALFGALNPGFLDANQLLNSMPDFIYFGIIAFPLGMIMLTGGIDISIGSVASLAGITCGVVFARTGSIWLGVLLGLVAGLVCGTINGLLITITRAQPMVITLGTQFLFAGLALGVSGLGGVSSFEGISGLPDDFAALTGGAIATIPNMVWWFIAAAIVFVVLIQRTTFGTQMRLLGVNPRAAEFAGFRVNRLVISGYAITGLVAALVGILLVSYTGSARADIGAGILMPTLTLVVIGGVSMFGGEGTMGGIVIAALVMGFLSSGLRFSGLDENQVSIITGSVLVIVAATRWWSGRATETWKNRTIKRTLKRQAAPAPAASEPVPVH